MKRRAFVKNSAFTAFSIASFGFVNWNGESFEGDTITTTDILGPFYRPGAPMRSNLIPAGSTGVVMQLYGTVYQQDGKTALANALVESWQCDEHEQYDNASDEYRFRGSAKTGKDGKYAFKTIVPVPYGDADGWRPAHIHLRISSASQQDLITQIYFTGDPHIEKDPAAASPASAGRILTIKKNNRNENSVKFDVRMGKSFLPDDASYKKITGIYKLKNGLAEFYKEDDLLFVKMNGQIMEGMLYKGNNSFEGGLHFNKAAFEILANGDVKTTLTMWAGWSAAQPGGEIFEGIKILKYTR